MKQVPVEELSKISAFISSCNDMINGKFILADMKISKIIKMITSSDELYKYISSCLVGFDFAKELHRAEVKNRFNGGEFVLPEDGQKIVAMVFNLLAGFNSKQIDFYVFIKNNFSTIADDTHYSNFSKKVLIPFRDIIAKEFGLSSDDHQNAMSVPPIEEIPESEATAVELPENNLAEPLEDEKPATDYWATLLTATDELMQTVISDRKIKSELKDELIYLLKSVKHSMEYRDIQIVSALLSAVDILTKKFRSVRFVFTEAEQCVLALYDEQRKLQETEA